MQNSNNTGLREILIDTETTGLDSKGSDRIVEIACVEVVDLLPTGRTWHTYLNPDREIPPGALRVHGLTRAFLADKPRFKDKASEFLAWIGDAPLVAHNASFDMGFINAELVRARLPPLKNDYVDTIALAKKMLPAGSKMTLDALCLRFGIDLSKRVRHEALLDTQLLARVYLELRGGRHRALDLGNTASEAPRVAGASVGGFFRPIRPARTLGAPSAADQARHAEFLKAIKDPLWTAEQNEAPTQRM